jgi:type VI secretion system secreted protein VgrG
MNPKSGKEGSAVQPVEPKMALTADLADPGEMAKIKAQEMKQQTGKYGSTSLKPNKPPETEEEKQKKTGWIEIELVDQDDQPVPGESYRIILPDGESVAEGTLDEKGFARIEDIEPGTCKITFQNQDKDSWKTA